MDGLIIGTPIFPLCSCPTATTAKQIIIGKIQRYSQHKKKFGQWETLYACSKCHLHHSKKADTWLVDDNKITISLNRGGTLVYYPNIFHDKNEAGEGSKGSNEDKSKDEDEDERETISKYMDQSDLFRQYKTNGFNEPRVHVLLSPSASADTEAGYVYHNVRMKALPIELAPPIHKLAARLGRKFESFSSSSSSNNNNNNNNWNIGVDMIIYRNGKDKIGWHADDTQGETIIFTIVIETDERRIIKIRPKKKKIDMNRNNMNMNNDNDGSSYYDGDENIELIVRSGCGYSMNGMLYRYTQGLKKIIFYSYLCFIYYPLDVCMLLFMYFVNWSLDWLFG